MKIAHVTLYPPKGEKHVSSSGVASYSKNLVTNLTLADDEQTVVCNKVNSEEVYEEDGITIRRVFERSPKFFLQIHKELRAVKPDIVHIQQELALYGGVATAYLLQWLVFLWRSKTIITLHGVIDPRAIDATFVRENNSRLPVWLVRLAFRVIYTPLMKWAKRVIVHEKYFKDIMVDAYHIQPEKIDVIPHGVEALETVGQASARKRLDLPVKANVALFMGYATGYKGLDLLIEGFAAYARDHSDAYLIIGAGKHPKLTDDVTYLQEYARLQAKAMQMIPEKQYLWRGFIEEKEITTYYSASDVSLYPYTTAMSSSGPMALAIGYEKPFLVSDAFGQIFQEYPELIFSRRPAALSERLGYFFRHLEEYNEISRQLKQQRAWARVGELTSRAYRNVNDQEGAYEAEESITTG